MPVNPLIALQTRVPNVLNSVQQGVDIGNEINPNSNINQLRQVQIDSGKEGIASSRQNRQINDSRFQAEDAVMDAVPVLQSLQRGDLNGAVNRTKARIQKIQGRGGDPSDSMAFLQRLQASPEQAAAELGDIVALGQASGVLAQPKERERKIVKGADGFNYYADTQERVIPGAELPEKDTTLQDALAGLTIEEKRTRLANQQADRANQERERAKAEQAEARQTRIARRDATETLDLAKEIAADVDGFQAISGGSGKLPTAKPSTVSFIKKLDTLVSRLSLDNTEKLKGAISEGELELLSNTVSSIAEGGEYTDNIKAIESIVSRLEFALNDGENVVNSLVDKYAD